MELDQILREARSLDQQDPLSGFRQRFHIPKHGEQESIYFCGNSLGLQPKTVEKFISEELDAWKKYGVEGHFEGKRPWFHYHKFFPDLIKPIVGAKYDHEVVVMNTLTTNLHLLMVSFYKPENGRFKIITEAGNFPSDQYMLESQADFHGQSWDEAVIEIRPKEGERSLRTEDIISQIEKAGDSLALVMMSGVNYVSGQFFNLEKITQAGHSVGAKVGFDLAHAVGNLPLRLHDWGVDFATWCSYKYLNSGPGGPSGIFVHDRHADDKSIKRFAGWWGHKEEERFLMKPGFIPMKGAPSWQLSNAQVLSMAAHLASLEIFKEAGIEKLRKKSHEMSSFLDMQLAQIKSELGEVFEIITPKAFDSRGCQYSIVVPEKGKSVHKYLTEHGVISDWREPDVIRIAPVPLYNTFEDLAVFARLFKEALS